MIPAHMKNTAKAIVNLADAFSHVDPKAPGSRDLYIHAMESLVRMALVDAAMTEEVRDFAKCMGKPIAELG